jgi:hypothetical protein
MSYSPRQLGRIPPLKKLRSPEQARDIFTSFIFLKLFFLHIAGAKVDGRSQKSNTFA